jgi:hypothetical protein
MGAVSEPMGKVGQEPRGSGGGDDLCEALEGGFHCFSSKLGLQLFSTTPSMALETEGASRRETLLQERKDSS